MKLLIASDLHGSASACRALADAFEREKADKILLLGDLLYHGPRNNLPNAYDTKDTLNILNNYFEHVLCVRGNCDAEVDQCVLRFP
ncbi:MAG: metallophosphoesterase family protein, partial [Oscillospiraceae bacterium]|nr:metallophosphoesterase family protein [Oscillospiraceae bacterium]